jgi:alanyl-tRNA synthetase
MEINQPKHPRSATSISQLFLDYYESRGYKTIAGSSLLDPSVPMSFVMSAGLVQVERSAALQGRRKHDRYVLLQNCFRYFDLDTIGDSAYHLTLFRMAGAFTFGNVNRFACVSNNWDLLTRIFGLSPESIWVTYFEGGEVGGRFFEPDVETYQAWQMVGLPPERIIGLGPDSNFWKQGASVVGEREAPKCGPNTEVFYDRGSQFQCGLECKPGCRCGRFVEIQNTLLVIWYFDEERRLLKPLDEPFVEAVIGTERLEMLLQKKSSVFEIESVVHILEHIQKNEPEPVKSLAGRIKQERIVVNHIRSILFLTADGAPKPGHGGRARLMRKLIRGLLTALKLLRISDPQFIRTLIDLAISIYLEQHPALLGVRDLALRNILEESDLFERTLEKGTRHLDSLLQVHGGHLSAEDLVTIEKEFGVPNSLLSAMLQQRQVSFDQQTYQNAYAAWYQSVLD